MISQDVNKCIQDEFMHVSQTWNVESQMGFPRKIGCSIRVERFKESDTYGSGTYFPAAEYHTPEAVAERFSSKTTHKEHYFGPPADKIQALFWQMQKSGEKLFSIKIRHLTVGPKLSDRIVTDVCDLNSTREALLSKCEPIKSIVLEKLEDLLESL